MTKNCTSFRLVCEILLENVGAHQMQKSSKFVFNLVPLNSAKTLFHSETMHHHQPSFLPSLYFQARKILVRTTGVLGHEKESCVSCHFHVSAHAALSTLAGHHVMNLVSLSFIICSLSQ